MAIHAPCRKLTVEDFSRFEHEDGFQHEILDGEHLVTPAPFLPHQWLSKLLFRTLDAFVAKNSLGEVFYAPLGVVLSPNDVLEPDLLFVSSERKAILSGKYVVGAPELVVEILSDSTRRRDLGVKRACYERFGVREYWVFDWERRTAMVFRRPRPDAEQFGPPEPHSAEQLLKSPLFPGLEIELRDVFDPVTEGE